MRYFQNYPIRLFACLSLVVISLALLFVIAMNSAADNGADAMPTMQKPSLFYLLGEMFDAHDSRNQKLQRQTWQGQLEMARHLADPHQSAIAVGTSQTSGIGVPPNAIGKISDQELLHFRQNQRSAANESWDTAPPDIRRERQRMYRNLGIAR